MSLFLGGDSFFSISGDSSVSPVASGDNSDVDDQQQTSEDKPVEKSKRVRKALVWYIGVAVDGEGQGDQFYHRQNALSLAILFSFSMAVHCCFMLLSCSAWRSGW